MSLLVRNVSQLAKWPALHPFGRTEKIEIQGKHILKLPSSDRNTDRRNLYLVVADNNSCKWPVRTQNSSSNANPDIRP